MRMPRSSFSVAVLAIATAGGSALAGVCWADGTAEGRRIATTVCASCHVVAKDQDSRPILDPPAPSFESIANRPDAKAADLRRYVLTTHWDEKTIPITMPNPGLTPSQATAVIDYLMTLRIR
jgi:mono/diheme cytochrome c family protein